MGEEPGDALRLLTIVVVFASFAMTFAAMVWRAVGVPASDRAATAAHSTMTVVAVVSALVAGSVLATATGSFVGVELSRIQGGGIVPQLAGVAVVAAVTGVVAAWLSWGRMTIGRTLPYGAVAAAMPAIWFLVQHLGR